MPPHIYIYIYVPHTVVYCCHVLNQSIFFSLQCCSDVQEENKMLEPYVSFVDEDALYSVYLIVVDKRVIDDVLTLISLLL